MTEVLSNAAPIVSEAEPLALAMQLEQARQHLLLLLLGDGQASALLHEQCLFQLNNGKDMSDFVRDNTDDALIVQDVNFVQPNLGQIDPQLLNGAVARSLLFNLHFTPGFLIEVAALCLSTTDDSDYSARLTSAAQNLQRLRQQMIAANMGLVAFVAHKQKTTALGFDDLLQEGVVGLIKAVERFDPYRGFQFSTYAMPWIKQAISRLIVKQEKTVRLPVSLAEKAGAVFEAMRKSYLQTERWPSVEQLKTLCDLSEDEIKTIRSYYQATHSLDSASESEEDEGQTLMARMKQQQFAQPLDELIEHNLTQYLDQVMATLPDKEATILTLRFGLKNHTEMTLQAIADQLQVSRERVRQIQNEALKKLKNQFGCDLMLFLEPNDSY
ncbi:MAG: RNA polymerase sigma factor RpoD/SigA [Methylobacter sp.]|nr:RNA polymerase sigma factor RpoD/SigA [Methylobacter sp.]MDP2100728.1 RNA polymerase sigma factor RpoD/SigA [Methylobacter sp.]MDP2427806.1 RNA polymerase sigma factor RpoD/SigA [Methylobacter sp.]MDP3053894.1 RNA polymerase sigma factor RpoD/SigA [Methylobacter sp.]MDP3360541.1 RNA polymerase sigma factor RpoD/SigA [Methylobacter sp.]